jgi:hypothetical protein
VFQNPLGSGDTLPDVEAVILSILPILSLLPFAFFMLAQPIGCVRALL